MYQNRPSFFARTVLLGVSVGSFALMVYGFFGQGIWAGCGLVLFITSLICHLAIGAVGSEAGEAQGKNFAEPFQRAS